ncbi:MAG: FecR domain-containing protein [Chitinophagaceae bacterium]|nr:FecR domain-containing protein [Chitinophagaceae bacterium]
MSANKGAKYLEELAQKVLAGTASEEEKLFLEEYYNAFEKHPDAQARLTAEELQHLQQTTRQKIHSQITDISLPLRNRHMIWRWVAAATFLICIAGSALFFLKKTSNTTVVKALPKNEAEFLPGGNKATLILNNGATIVLDDAQNGSLAQQGNTEINKTTDGQLIYKLTKQDPSPEAIQYNTITTPKGGQYQVRLPDGTQVWLNAASSIRFPTSFTENERAVAITGEVYFEVAHNRQAPFIVSAGNTRVQVLGTSFNMMAYDNEDMKKTTLVEGSIQLTDGNRTSMLQPGEQMQVNEKDFKLIKHADVAAALAWKNGLFYFKDAGLQTVMKQVERWYNISVKFEGNIPEKQFNGKVPRNANLAELMEILSFYDDMKCTIDNDTITIMQRHNNH